MKTFVVCSGESQPIFTTPCLQSLLNFALFDEKKFSAQQDATFRLLGERLKGKLCSLFSDLVLICFTLSECTVTISFVIARSAKSELT